MIDKYKNSLDYVPAFDNIVDQLTFEPFDNVSKESKIIIGSIKKLRIIDIYFQVVTSVGILGNGFLIIDDDIYRLLLSTVHSVKDKTFDITDAFWVASNKNFKEKLTNNLSKFLIGNFYKPRKFEFYSPEKVHFDKMLKLDRILDTEYYNKDDKIFKKKEHKMKLTIHNENDISDWKNIKKDLKKHSKSIFDLF